MKFRLTIFFIFQVVAWTVYFNWETSMDGQNITVRTEKVLQVEEMSASQFASLNTRKALYKIILRNDGFFTKINADQSVENGLWALDHAIPSLVLRSPAGNQKYRIIEDSPEFIQVELMNPHDLIQTKNIEEEEPTLFSSVN